VDPNHFGELTREVTKEEVWNVLKSLGDNKAPGPDVYLFIVELLAYYRFAQTSRFQATGEIFLVLS